MTEKRKISIYKENKGDKVSWVEKSDTIGEFLFTFDMKKVYNLFGDYPNKLSVEEWITFNKENPYWENFFKESNVRYAMEHEEELDKIGREDLIKHWIDKGISG